MINYMAIAGGGIQTDTDILDMLIATRGFTPQSALVINLQGQYTVPPKATINGIECNVTNFGTVLSYVQSKTKTPGSNFNVIRPMGWDVMTLHVSGVERTEAQRQAVLNEFAREQVNDFVFHEGWIYKVKLEEITPEEDIGFLTSFPWTVRLVSETPFRYSINESQYDIYIDDNPMSISEDEDGRSIITASESGALVDILLTSSESSAIIYKRVDRWV